MAQTMAVEVNEQKRWQHVTKLLSRAGPFAAETFVPDTPEESKVNKKTLTGSWHVTPSFLAFFFVET